MAANDGPGQGRGGRNQNEDDNRRQPEPQDMGGVDIAQRRRAARLANDQTRIFLPNSHGDWTFDKYYKSRPPIELNGQFNFREVAGDRPFTPTTMDPINLYYSLGADKRQENITFENATDPLGNYYTNLEDEELENLSYVPRGSYIVNWSYGGFSRTNLNAQDGRISRGDGNLTRRGRGGSTLYIGGSVDGLSRQEEDRYFAALNDGVPRQTNPPFYSGIADKKDLYFSSLMFNTNFNIPLEEYGNFNMVSALDELWKSTNLDTGDQQYSILTIMRRLSSHTNNKVTITRNQLGLRTGIGHRVDWSPAATAMINSVGLVTQGGADDDFRRSAREANGEPQARWTPLGNANYRRSRDDELRRIRQIEQRNRGEIEKDVDRLIINEFVPGLYLPPPTTLFDVYEHILDHMGDSRALRDRLESIVLALLDNPIVRFETRVGGDRMGYYDELPSLSDISSASFAEYEYYNFMTEVPFVRDKATDIVKDLPGTPGRFQSSITEGAFINPEYNYFLNEYEQAINNPQLSERALPNMYLYKLSSDSRSPDDQNESSVPPWEAIGQNNANTDPGFDGQITMTEFIENGVPLLRNEPTEELINLFNNFGSAAEGQRQDVVFEMSSERAAQYYNSTVEGGDIRIFEEFNQYKNSFPMYIEVGIPTRAPGVIASSLGSNFTSATITNALISGSSEFSSVARMDLYTTEINFEDTVPIRPYERMIKLDTDVQVLNFDEWIDGLDEIFTDLISTEEIGRTNSVGFNRNNFGPGQNNNTDLPAAIQAMKFWIGLQASWQAIDYKDLITGRKTSCTTETIMYKLVKYKHTENGREVISNFYFPNTPAYNNPYGEKLVDVIKFVDTQVKYGAQYEYELFHVDAVYGSKFRFRRRLRELPTTPQQDPFLNKMFYSFNVETIPDVKIIEYPVITNAWSRAVSSDFGEQAESPNKGVSYPKAFVLDRPPPAPDVNIVPYAGEPRKALIMLNAQGASYLKNKAQKPIPFNSEQANQIPLIREHQLTFENYNLPPGKLEYKNEGLDEIKEMIIYRSTDINPLDKYQTFVGLPPYKVMSTKPDAPAIQAVSSFDFVDELEPNTKYYYTFKCRDVHNKYSFPSEVYEIEMISDKGLFIPEIKIYEPNLSSGKKSSKEVVRYLEISAADIQKNPVQESIQAELPTYSARSLVNGDQCIADSNGEKVDKFIVRLTSKDTGKKIDLVVKFNINEEEGAS